MEKYIYDENNGLWYELQGDYYIPCLKLPDEEQVEIGIWGQRHLSYIQKHCKPFYNKMVSEHTLYDYLLQVNRDAEETFSELVKRMAEQEGITEQLKADNQLEWMGRMNNIHQRATEIVNTEMIYV
jgi:hypothetical protein